MDRERAAIAELLRKGQFEEAERRAIALLRANRLDAQGWVLLGEALARRSYGHSARRCFRRAWLLDPLAAWAENIERMVSKAPAGDERADVEGLLRVPAVTVSAVVIAKNEEATVARCLESVQGAVDRVLFFDNGSADGTMRIAERVPNVEVRCLEWKGGFGELRNEALRYVETDWVLWLDADEWLHEDDREAVKEAAGCYHALNRPVVLNIWHLNYVHDHIKHDISQGRLFTVGRGLQYYGRIHEQVGTERGGVYDPAPFRSAVRIRCHHAGYEPAVIRSKDKIERNRTLLLRAVEEEADNPGWWYFLGRETLAAGRYAEGLDALRRAEALAKRQPAFGRMVDVYKLMLHACKKLGDEKEAARVYDAMLAVEPNHPDVRLLWAERERKEAQRLLKKAAMSLEAARSGFGTYRGAVSADRSIWRWRADAAAAEMQRGFGRLSQAVILFGRAGRSRGHEVPGAAFAAEQAAKLMQAGSLRGVWQNERRPQEADGLADAKPHKEERMKERVRADPPSAAPQGERVTSWGEAEGRAFSLIRANPLHPQGWLSLAECYIGLGRLRSARLAAERGAMLDPEGVWYERLIAHCAGASAEADADEALQRALRAPRPTVAAVIVAKNAEGTIARCLDSLSGAVDEIMLLDLGSSDRTAEIAAGCPGAAVHRSPAQDGHAAARNEALSRVRSDWVLWIDPDEWLHPEDKLQIRVAAGLYDGLPVPALLHVWRLIRTDGDIADDFSAPRLFAVRHGFRFAGRAGESLVLAGEARPVLRRKVRVRLHADRRDGSATGGKPTPASEDEGRRRLRLAEQRGNASAALEARIFLMRGAWTRGDKEETLRHCERILEERPDFPDAHYFVACVYLKLAGEGFRAAEAHAVAAAEGAMTYRGTVAPDLSIREWRAPAMMADLAMHRGDLKEAGEIYSACLEKAGPNAGTIRRKLAFIEHQLKKLEEAERQRHTSLPPV